MSNRALQLPRPLLAAWVACGIACGCSDAPTHDPIDRPPAITAPPVMTAEDTPLHVRIVVEDPDGDPIVLVARPPAHGVLVQNGVELAYTPDRDFAGADEVMLTATAGSSDVVATLSIEVVPVDDPPKAVDDQLDAVADSVATFAPQALLANDVDVDGDGLSIVAVSNASAGTVALVGGQVVFTPTATFTGEAAFQYTISDGTTTGSATAKLAVERANAPPVAFGDSMVITEDASLIALGELLVANDTDADGDMLTVTAVGGAQHGTVALYATTAVFEPDTDYAGPASFTYTVSDGTATATGTVVITVDPVDDPPRPAKDYLLTDEDVALAIPVAALLANDVDVEGEPMTVTEVVCIYSSLCSASLANDVVTITPTANFHGDAQLYYMVSAGSALAYGSIVIRIASIPDAPVANPEAFTILRDRPLVVGVAGLLRNDADADADAISLISVGSPTNGAVTLNGTLVRFIPDPGFEGTASFEYTIEDATGATDSETVTIEVTPSLGVAGGARHACALLSSGAVKCWGDAASGQLGLGNTTRIGDNAGEMGASLAPVDLGTGRTATKITAGAFHTCALLDDGTVKCWGEGSSGATGLETAARIGDGPSEMGDLLPAVALGTGRTAIDVDAGSTHTCAVLDTGAVKCWGSNTFGQLGLGDNVTRGTTVGQMGDALPVVDLGTGRTAIAIAAGSDHTCAILDNATLKCWGFNNTGQLGLNNTTYYGDNPGEMGDALPAVILGTGRTALAVDAARNVTCAWLDNFDARCWGSNSLGQLGIGSTSSRGSLPGQMEGLGGIWLGTGRTTRAVTIGSFHTCALLDNQRVKCWGASPRGQLGYGDTVTRGDSYSELGDNLPFVDLGTAASVISFAAGQDHTCAVLGNATVKCWGDNTYGQLGQGDIAHRGDNSNELGNTLQPISL